MLNLVQIQDKLKDLPTQAVASYANGQNPMVPPYLALGELNRRKQMEQSAAAEQAKSMGDQPTIKEQTEQQLGLMNLQQQRQQQAAQQMGNAMANTVAQVPPGVGQQPVQMARGGLARLPIRPTMFKRSDYAGGGIVAFQSGGEPDQEMRDFDQAAALYEAEREARMAKEQSQPTKVDAAALLRKLVQQAEKGTTIEDTAAQIKRSKELAGVLEDPYAESRKEREGLVALRRAYEADQPSRDLRATLLGIAKAKPGQGLGMALGSGSEEYAKEEERFRSLQDQQRVQEMQWMRADEKEKDAIARGDAKAMLEAQQEKEKLSYNISKLSTDKDRLAFDKFNAAVNANTTIKSLEKQRQEEDPRPGSERWRWFDDAINQIKLGLAKEAGYEGPVATITSPPEIPKPGKKKTGLSGGSTEEKKDTSSKTSYDTGIPSSLPKGTTVAGRTPDGKVVYLTPDGKKVIEK